LPRKIGPQQENRRKLQALPMPWVGKPRSDAWGFDAVKLREVDKGIEDAELFNWYLC
jgi:hypothetical protein